MNKNEDIGTVEKIIDTLLSTTGFVKCEFRPEKDEECEGCNKDNLQLYYHRTCWDVDEGEYYCIDCVEAQHENDIKHYAKLGN